MSLCDRSLTHLLTHSLAYLLTRSLTHLLTYGIGIFVVPQAVCDCTVRYTGLIELFRFALISPFYHA